MFIRLSVYLTPIYLSICLTRLCVSGSASLSSYRHICVAIWMFKGPFLRVFVWDETDQASRSEVVLDVQRERDVAVLYVH